MKCFYFSSNILLKDNNLICPRKVGQTITYPDMILSGGKHYGCYKAA